MVAKALFNVLNPSKLMSSVIVLLLSTMAIAGVSITSQPSSLNNSVEKIQVEQPVEVDMIATSQERVSDLKHYQIEQEIDMMLIELAALDDQALDSTSPIDYQMNYLLARVNEKTYR